MSAHPPDAPPRDLTCVLVAAEEHDEESIRKVVVQRGYGDSWLRVAPLAGEAEGLVQVELFSPDGLPRIDPALVADLSDGDRRATFFPVNHTAKQALVHSFVGGKQVGEGGWVGDPSELDAHLGPAVGKTLAQIAAGDDGTREGLGSSASHTFALVRGRSFTVPIGVSMGLHSFGFHDRFSRHHKEPDRVALIAFDPKSVRHVWRGTPGAEVAARIATLPTGVVGPLRGVRDAAVSALASLGDKTPEEGQLRSVIAYELATLSECYLFASGEATTYVDERFLPMFTLGHGDPAIDDAEEAEELESRGSVLDAMAEVLPYSSPEGAMLEQIADEELTPLAPWGNEEGEYVGSIFQLSDERLRKLLVDSDRQEMAGRIDRFYRAWYRSQYESMTEVLFQNWRHKMDDKGARDTERFLLDWAEWRTVLAIAHQNHLQTALVFYGIDAATEGT
jgi:hypothetical protein